MQETSPARYHDAWRAVVVANGILVPGGFGQRGSDGMMLAIKYARESKVPFLGICFGFQLAVVEWAKNVLNLPREFFSRSSRVFDKRAADATSGEFDPEAKHPIIVFMPEISRTHMGGTMRLGLRPTVFEEGSETWSKARALYGGAGKIWERHRHRYEVNPAYVVQLQQSGLCFVGKDEKKERMQVLELKGSRCSIILFYGLLHGQLDHPYFIGLQAHPEFCTRPLNPSPPFVGFIAAASGTTEFEEQLELQKTTFKPPHPEHAMVSEAELKAGLGLKEVFVTSPIDAMAGKEPVNGWATPKETRE